MLYWMQKLVKILLKFDKILTKFSQNLEECFMARSCDQKRRADPLLEPGGHLLEVVGPDRLREAVLDDREHELGRLHVLHPGLDPHFGAIQIPNSGNLMSGLQISKPFSNFMISISSIFLSLLSKPA